MNFMHYIDFIDIPGGYGALTFYTRDCDCLCKNQEVLTTIKNFVH